MFYRVLKILDKISILTLGCKENIMLKKIIIILVIFSKAHQLDTDGFYSEQDSNVGIRRISTKISYRPTANASEDITPDIQQAIVDAHNKFRAEVLRSLC